MKSQKMYIIVFGFFIIKLQISVSEPQFPPHIDLQKVGETIFNNEKFNILKPTIHSVTDHFKEFMLRTENSYHPAKRVFIDNNGFRHNWSGFGDKTKSLRKTDLKPVRGNFGNEISKKDNDKATSAAEDNTVSSTENENNNREVENNASDNNDTIQHLNEEDYGTHESEEMTTILNLFPTIQKHNSSSNITIGKWLRQKKDNSKGTPTNKADPTKKANATKKPDTTKKADTKKKDTTTKKNDTTKKTDDEKKDAPVKKADDKKDKKTESGDKAKKDGKKAEKSSKDNKERTVISTTFFCPYFGSITMSSFID